MWSQGAILWDAHLLSPAQSSQYAGKELGSMVTDPVVSTGSMVGHGAPAKAGAIDPPQSEGHCQGPWDCLSKESLTKSGSASVQDTLAFGGASFPHWIRGSWNNVLSLDRSLCGSFSMGGHISRFKAFRFNPSLLPFPSGGVEGSVLCTSQTRDRQGDGRIWDTEISV